MSKWIDFSIDERRAMIQAVSQAKQIDEASAEKDWWVTAVLYAMFHTSISEYLLFKGGTSLSKGWNIINRFSEDIDLALSRDYFLNVKKLSCASCTSNTQIHNLREKGQDYEVCGTLVPTGTSSPFTSLASGRLSFQENTDFTERCVNESGLLFKASAASGYHLYYQSEDVDENGITRYAANGETAYLNSYRFAVGTWEPDVAFLEFGFGMIYLDNFHDHDLFTASQECRTMTKVNILASDRKESLYHLRNAEATDGNGFAYCALASLFGGDGIYNYDLFL